MKAGGELLKRAFANGTWEAYRNRELIDVDDLHIGANSIDVTLHPSILLPDANQHLDLRKPSSCHYSQHSMDPEDGWVLFPNGFLLGAVNERFVTDNPLPIKVRVSYRRPTAYEVISQPTLFTQEVHGRSTLGRCGLCIHATAGYGDYGFQGAFTLEIFNVTNRPIILYPEIKVAQVEFNAVHRPITYGGAYRGDHHYDGPVAPDLRGRF